MILVTVANHTQGFQRLIDWMDVIASERGEETVMQIGHTRREPRHARWFRQVPLEEMERLTREARVVVGHAGAGTILTTLRLGAPLIVVPRQAALGEHIDDHQDELAGALAGRGDIAIVHTLEALRDVVASPPPPGGPDEGQGTLVDVLRGRVASIAREVDG